MKNPRLRIRRRLLVDRERTPPGHLFHEIDSEVEPLELRRQVEAQSRLSYAVGSDERYLQAAARRHISREQLANVRRHNQRLRAGCAAVKLEKPAGGSSTETGIRSSARRTLSRV